ncbi:MAG TPA: HGGxSTG domain-containing protein [Intrasporangium sp.]|uniref:HGGxSTG domain-containing protein n=1 Tax=Intrasporangium sp. TaxID=1925024 RepID=UPI002D79E547|nr:HGGxSTG domain-containing protein [Intrasporangium sp.]HET7398979.1 HGGxSTG domain-containing protein [Intrasporangium sp.]
MADGRALCGAKTRNGGTCRKAPLAGATRCANHGGKSPKAQAKARERLAVQAAEREVARLGARRDIHPAEALLELVHWTAGEVDYWRARVVDLADTNEDALTWGRSSETDKGSGEFPGTETTSEAAPNIAYRMLTDASNRLAAYAAAALKAGVDERRVRLAESQGQLVAEVIRGILADLQLTPEQQTLVGTVVPTRLRQLAAEGASR